MLKKIEFYEGKPVFQASNSKKLAEAVAKYEGEVEPPYVVKLSTRSKKVVAGAFDEDETVGIVLLPDSVTEIEHDAFAECKNLVSINIPNSVTNIGDGAFFHCTGLIEINLPDSIEEIGESAFEGCTRLSSLYIPSSVAEMWGGAFADCSNLSSISVSPDNKWFDSRDNCNAIIDSSTNSLFAGCFNSIIPNTVESIDYMAFQGCTKLNSIEIPDSVKEIGTRAFAKCTRLSNIIIPKSVEDIGRCAFDDCNDLDVIRINNRQLIKDAGVPEWVEIKPLYAVSLEHFIDELRKFASNYPDRKVACMLDDGTPFYINDIDGTGEDNDAIVLSNYMDEGEDYTVAYFLKINPEDYDLHEVVILYFNTNAIGIEYACVHNIAELENGIFFNTKDGEEDIIAFLPDYVFDETVDDGECMDEIERARQKYWDNNNADEQKSYRRRHVFQDALEVIVGQLIRDLKYIIKMNPGSTLSFRDENANDVVISGIRMWKGIVLLKASWQEDDAITVETLLDLLQKYDDDTPVLMQMTCELRNLCVDEVEGQDYDLIFHNEEDEGYNYFNVASHDIRLFTPEDLSIFLEDYEHECPDRKIACQDIDGKLHLVTEIYDDCTNYIVVNDKEEGEGVTVSNLVNDFGWDHGGVVVIYGNKGLTKCIDDQKYCGIFFEDKLDGEDVIAFRLGETFYDPEEDEGNDDDFFTEDDIIINADDPWADA